MASETIQQLLRERACSDTVAVKYGERNWTWREHAMRPGQVESKNSTVAAALGSPVALCQWLPKATGCPQQRSQHHVGTRATIFAASVGLVEPTPQRHAAALRWLMCRPRCTRLATRANP